MPNFAAKNYPRDALSGRQDLDVITVDDAPTLDRLFSERVSRSGDRVAFTDFDFDANCWRHYTWEQMAAEVSRWQAALRQHGLRKGDNVGLRLRNCRHWVIFDQAALGLGLVVVPLYVADRADNVNYVLAEAEVKLLLVETLSEWTQLQAADGATPDLGLVVVLERCDPQDENVTSAHGWLPESAGRLAHGLTEPDELASIVFTSGTTGKPKGVMLSHGNMVSNAHAGLRSVAVSPDDVMLSFLPLSHTLERTAGYYLPLMAGARIAFNRSIQTLSADFLDIRPTAIITVPRIFERVYSELRARLEHGPALQMHLFEATADIGWKRFLWRQGRGGWKMSFLVWPLLDLLVARKIRAKFGARLRLAVVGGAPLPMAISKTLIPLGINLLQGYGLTESSPTVSINTLEQNKPETIGLPLYDVQVRIGDNEELLVKGPNVMLGYWRDKEATGEVLVDGWLYSGDQARIDDDGFLVITGRIKDILVLANGEKVAPADIESAIAADPLFEQLMVIGEQMPYLTALVVLNNSRWKSLVKGLNISADDEAALTTEPVERLVLARVREQTKGFPGYARIRRVTAMLEPWTVEDGLITPTLKLKRAVIRQRFETEIARMYEGHDTFKTELRRRT